MSIDGERAYDLLRKISFERRGGTDEERRAADILVQYLTACGLRPEVRTFDVWSYEPVEAALRVLTPHAEDYEVRVYGLTGSTPREGIEAEFIYAEEADEVALSGARSRIALVNRGVDRRRYRRMAEAEVAGFIAWGGEIYRREDLPRWAIRPEYFQYGKIPGVVLFADEAADLVQRGAETVRLTVRQNEAQVPSQNVVCEVPGDERPEEIVVITAHYDSVPHSAGANDNAAGSAIIAELARHFVEHPPARTLRFIWCGSEELGLRGSFAYVRENEHQLDDIRLVLNVDVAGGILGRNRAVVTGPDSLRHHVRVMSRSTGLPVAVKSDVYSSDSVPFAERGIPSLNLMRFGAPVHNRHDRVKYLSAERLEDLGRFALHFLHDVDGARVFPFAREIPNEVQKKLDRYLRRRRGKDDEAEE